MFDTKNNEYMNYAIAYIAPKKDDSRHNEPKQ